MKRAFIFDVDGVLANTEPSWESAKKEIFFQFLNEEIVSLMGSTVGIDMQGMYDLAVQHGAMLDKEKFFQSFYTKADWVYKDANLTPGLDELGETLNKLGYSIGVVSASPREWIGGVIGRLSFKEKIEHVISLQDREDLLHKPVPDGYLEAMRQMGSGPEATIILEDSNAGIASAKSAGAFTIGLTENLVPGYIQKGADVYVDSVQEVIEILENRP